MSPKKLISYTIIGIFIGGLFLPYLVLAEEVRTIVFPVRGEYSFSDDFGDPRSGGRTHEGIDIIAAKMTPALAAVDGEVSFITTTERDWGYAVYIRDQDGYTYRYLHINNDTPGTDDGNGGTLYAFPPTIYRGAPVAKGQVVAYIGDSGNAENVGSHLHFEIHRPDGTPINPYPSLLAAERPGAFNPEAVRGAVGSISTERGLSQIENPYCVADSLLKVADSDAVYYCGSDGKRYVFPNRNVYVSWYADFSAVQTISAEQMSAIQLVGNVTYKPGVRMVKIQTDPKVYAVDRGGVLRWVASDTIAASMYGPAWKNNIDDVSSVFFLNYQIGEPIIQPLQ